MRVGRSDTGAIEFRRRQRQLITLARHAGLPRPLHVEAVALAPTAGQRAVDEDVDAHVGAFGRMLIGRHHVIDHRFDECSLVKIEIGIPRSGAARRLGLCWLY